MVMLIRYLQGLRKEKLKKWKNSVKASKRLFFENSLISPRIFSIIMKLKAHHQKLGMKFVKTKLIGRAQSERKTTQCYDEKPN